MNLNATLLGQMIAFGLFVWFCWKFVWPPLLAAMEERAEKIEQGLKDSEESAKKILDAEEQSKKCWLRQKKKRKR
jgi:F-type H+-transporting ATPase subunit b